MNLTEDPVVEKVEEAFDDGGHILCCKLDDSFVGFTTTLCGRQVLEYEIAQLEDDEESDCDACNFLNKTTYCPLGGYCEYQ